MSQSELTIEELCEEMERLWLDKTPPKLEKRCCNVFCFEFERKKKPIQSLTKSETPINIT